MKKIKFEKSVTNEDGGNLKIEYLGEVEDNYKVPNQLEEKLNIFVNLFSKPYLQVFDQDMQEKVSVLRTILKDCNEKDLSIVCESNGNKEIIQYIDKTLKFYKIENQQYITTYQPHTGINFNYFLDQEVSETGNKVDAQYLFSSMMDYVYKLKAIKTLELDKETKMLLEYYKFFYNEIPDFMDQNINFKFQTMMVILKNFGVILSDNYSNYSISADFGVSIPSSYALAYSIKNLFALENISEIDCPVELDKKTKKIIQIIGSEVKENTSNGVYTNNTMIANMCNIIYASEYNCPSNPTGYEIGKLSTDSKCSTGDVKSTAILIKKIKTKLNNK